MSETGLVHIVEGALMAAGEPLSVKRLSQLFDEFERPTDEDISSALEEVAERCEGRGYELVRVASGFRFQVRQNLATWVGRLWQERPQRYSRALLETLSLIAYRQPITRGEIEEIRGVAVSSNIVKTLQEREWVRVVGHRDVPGRPAMYATTRQFLDYFNLKSLEDLPPLAEIKELDNLNGDLGLSVPDADALEQASEGSDTASDYAVSTDTLVDREESDPAIESDLDEGASVEPSGDNDVEAEQVEYRPEGSDYEPEQSHAAEASIEEYSSEELAEKQDTEEASEDDSQR